MRGIGPGPEEKRKGHHVKKGGYTAQGQRQVQK